MKSTRRGRLHQVGMFLPILLASGFGYFVYNLALVIGYVKPSNVGIVQCAQSFGTIGCPDTINGLLYVLFGAVIVFAIIRVTGYSFTRNRG